MLQNHDRMPSSLTQAMRRLNRKYMLTLFALLPLVAGLAAIAWNPRLQFLAGGAMINIGYRLQDALHDFDFEHLDSLTPSQIWNEVRKQNSMAARVRSTFPRTATHPLVAMLVCMDARIDTNELTGDTRRYYYVVRTAGSILGDVEQEMLELAVVNGVKVLVLTTHTDCAAEKIARDVSKHDAFPVLAKAVTERNQRVAQFLARPAIASRISSGELLVKRMRIDTENDWLVDEE